MAEKTKGYFCLALWAALIIAGIVGKRVFHQPDLVVFFHLPGAIFLVLGWYWLSHELRVRYQKDQEALQERMSWRKTKES